MLVGVTLALALVAIMATHKCASPPGCPASGARNAGGAFFGTLVMLPAG
jgi:hypothetical protein